MKLANKKEDLIPRYEIHTLMLHISSEIYKEQETGQPLFSKPLFTLLGVLVK